MILFDRRGSGLSDRVAQPPTLEEEVADVEAVLRAAGSERMAVVGYAGGGPLAVLLAARRPERAVGLVLYAAMMRNTAAPDYDFAHTRDEREARFAEMAREWGQASRVEQVAPSRAGDVRFGEWLARLERLSVSPGAIVSLVAASSEHDVRELLPAIRVPTLVLHRRGDRLIDVGHSRVAAEQIPGARYVELEGEDHLITAGDSDAILDEIEDFLIGSRSGSSSRRALLTVMFTDIVAGTRRAAQLGDARWRDLLASHEAVVRRELDRFGGREVKTIGDGFLVTFAGAPSGAVRCAQAICRAVRDLGIEVRIGLHTGECELIGDDVGGMAVHIAARVGALAEAGQVLVSGTVCGVVAGSGLGFADRGSHALRGVPGEWPLFCLEG